MRHLAGDVDSVGRKARCQERYLLTPLGHIDRSVERCAGNPAGVVK